MRPALSKTFVEEHDHDDEDVWNPNPPQTWNEWWASFLLGLPPLPNPTRAGRELRGKMMVAGALENVVALVNSNAEFFHPDDNKWKLQQRRRMTTRIDASIKGYVKDDW